MNGISPTTALLVAAVFVSTAAAAAAPPTIAVLDFGMINTSLLPETPAEKARLVSLGQQLRTALGKSGSYHVISGARMRAVQSTEPVAADCNACANSLARKLGADLVAVDYVQKVSDLILNINVIIENVRTGKMVGGGSVDIRGNTDLSWQRGLDFLLSDYRLLGH